MDIKALIQKKDGTLTKQECNYLKREYNKIYCCGKGFNGCCCNEKNRIKIKTLWLEYFKKEEE